MFWEIAIPVALLLIAIALSGLRIAREYERAVVFRLGRLVGLRGPGLYWLIPLGIEMQRDGVARRQLPRARRLLQIPLRTRPRARGEGPVESLDEQPPRLAIADR